MGGPYGTLGSRAGATGSPDHILVLVEEMSKSGKGHQLERLIADGYDGVPGRERSGV